MPMKKLYLIARNHMDPSWLRCFTDHFDHPETGDVVRPYADVEELQILEYMDFAELYGVKYQIEQALTVKKFLARNPDQFHRFQSLVQKGLIELAGGGETVIDRNLTQGESWARSDLYAREYYEKNFGVHPRYAITPDIFGLPAQLPQYFRSVGYDALIIFDRVFKHNKPFWRGLDGTCIVLDGCFLQPPEPNLRTADCVKLPACPVCRGRGCDLCEGTGIDTSYDMTRFDKELRQGAYYGNMTADVFLETLLETEKDEYFVMITTEEPRIGDFLYGPLAAAAARHDMEVRYLGFEENHDLWCAGQVERLRAGDIPEDLVDPRPEGNPAGCGCYSSRIEIKKANRALEDLLLEAEALAALTRLSGGWQADTLPRRDYPQKKIADAWSRLAFVQFHDCVTGTHVDAGYEELKRYAREIRRSAAQIYADAAEEFLKTHGFAVPEGYYAAVAFNPTAQPLAYPLLRLHAPAEAGRIAVFDLAGNRLPAFAQTLTPMLVGKGATLRVKAEIPAFGWRAFLWKPEPAPEVVARRAVLAIENEYFRISAAQTGVAEIYDKLRGRPLLGANAGGLAIGTDVGSPWGRAEPERDHRALPPAAARAERGEGFSRLIFTGSFADESRGIEKLNWTQTVSLYDGEPLVRYRTEIDWAGRNTRVFADFSPAFSHDGRVWCEVPFGMTARGQPEVVNCLGLTDEWPSLGYAGLSGDGVSFAVLKSGLAGTRVHENNLQISLLRSFSSQDPRYRGTTDCGVHTAEYAAACWQGDFPAGDPAAKAAAYLTQGFTAELAAPGKRREPSLLPAANTAEQGSLLGWLSPLPAGLRLSTLKWAQDGAGPVVRFWESAGKKPTLILPAGVTLLPCDTLERPLGKDAVSAYTFRPFEIATFRVQGAGS